MRQRWGDGLAALGQAMALAGQILVALPYAAVRPRLWLPLLYHHLVGTLPLLAVAGAAMGIVAWLQLRQILAQFQSVELLPSALALSVTWEFGPIAAGLIAAARLGAGLGAELGAMRISEQLDAASVLGVAVTRRLLAPRVWAAMLALPILCIFVNWLAIVSGFLAEAVGGTMTWDAYQREALRYLKLKDVIPATLKTVVFGYLIGVAGCAAGLAAEGGTEGVGRAAHRAVVSAMLAVLCADVLCVRLIHLLVP
ncbi:MAG TPA: ABC transporter permease [Gemmatales bacterium]|nr:ABC transporter permease [Gemmatales bacterium]HMP58033.1 ABC transporter permease [Gemmatales bacterium]